MLVLVAAGAWLWLAPSRVGGSTDYVATRGDSMAPRFQTGDLALIRPAESYRVGEIVAYRSRHLGTTVLHRIIGRDGARYVLKGDNNDFIDPDRPSRSDLIGKLWVRVPNGGLVLSWLDNRVLAGILAGGAALLLLESGRRRRRRRARRRQGNDKLRHPENRPMTTLRQRAIPRIDARSALTGSLAALGVFVGLGLLAFTRPTSQPATAKLPYVEKASFSYRAHAADGPVYPGGVVRTGDPIFLKLVRRLRVKVDYRFAANRSHQLTGTKQVLLRLTSPTGWKRTIELTPRRRFEGDHASAAVTLDLASLRSLFSRVEKATGAPEGGAYTVAVEPRLHLTGTLDGEPLEADFRPALSFELNALQLRPGGGASGDQQDSLNPSRRGTVPAATFKPNTLAIGGHGLSVGAARWIALIGALLASGIAFMARRRLRQEPMDPNARIRTRYAHLIVPIAGVAHDPTRPPIDVTSIEALVQLAERSERLVLHHQAPDGDTYLVDDEGTTYRYQARPGGHPATRSAAAVAVS